MLYSELLKGLMQKPQYAQGGVGGSFVPQISTNRGTKTYTPAKTYSTPAPKPAPRVYYTPAPKPQYSTPSNAVGMSTNQGPVYNTGSGSYSASSGQPVNLQRIAYTAPNIVKSTGITYNKPSQDLSNLGTGFGNLSSLNKGYQVSLNNAQNALKQTLGGFAGTIGTLGTSLVKNVAPNIYRGAQAIRGLDKNYKGTNPFEFGLSEFGNVQAAERTPNIINESSNKINSLQSKVPTTVNRGVTPNPVTGEDLTAKQDQLVKDVATNNKELDDFYALINDPAIQGQLDSIDQRIYDEAVANNWSQEEYNQKVFDEQKAVLLDQYNKLKAEAEGEIPYLETQTNAAIADEEAGLEKTAKAAEAKKAETNMTYDELLKKSVSTQRDEENRLRNVFSNLGTSESSAFINKLGSLVGERGAERSKIDLTRAKDLTSIADFITEQQTSSAKNTKAYKDQLAENIRQIKSYITNDLGSQTAQGISGLSQNLYSKLAEGKQNLFNTKAALLQNQGTRAQNMQDKLGTYALEKGLIKEQADATAGLTGNGAGMIQGYTRPSGFESSLWDTVETLKKQGNNKDSILSQIAGTYRDPKYAWMLEYLGKILA